RLSDEENITALSRNLAKTFGVKDVEDSAALAAVMTSFAKWEEVADDIASGKATGAVERKLESLLGNEVTTRTLDAERQSAIEGVRGIYGQEADRARERAAEAKIGGAFWTEKGM